MNKKIQLLVYACGLWLAILPLVMLNDQFSGSILPKRAAFQIGFTALLTAALAVNLHWQTSRTRLIRLLFLLGPLTVVILLYWRSAPSAYLAGPLAQNWLFACALTLFLTFFPLRLDDFRWLLYGLVLGASLVATIGIAQYLFDVEWFKQATPLAASTFLNKNFSAHYVAVLIPASLGLVFLAKSLTSRVLASGALALMGIYLLYARSLNGWVTALFVTLVFLAIVIVGWRKKSFPISRSVSGSLAAALLTIVAASFLPPAPNQNTNYSSSGLKSVGDAAALLFNPSVRNDKARYGKIGAREALYRNTWLMILENGAFGVGIGQFTAQFPRHANRFPPKPLPGFESFENYTHNDYLQWLAEFGIPGAIALTCLIGGSFWLLFQTGRHITPENLIPFAISGGMLLAIGMTASLSFPFYRDLHPALLAIAIALLIRIAPDCPKAKMVPLHLGTQARVVSTLVAFALLGTLVWQYHKILKADQLYIRSAYANRDGDVTKLANLTEATLALDPHQPWALTNAGVLKLNAGQPATAIRHFEAIHRNFPFASENLIHMGLAYTRMQRYPEAIKVLEQALENRPGNNKAITPLANAHLLYASQLASDPYKRGEVIKHVEAVLKLAPDHPQRIQLRAQVNLLRKLP